MNSPDKFASSKAIIKDFKLTDNKPVCPKEFWCNKYDNPDGSLCCFNHWVGLPTRWGLRHPIYEYQKEIIKTTLSKKYIWILKAPKLGITELYLRFCIWKALTDPLWSNGQVAIIVGTNTGEAETMISRAKGIIRNLDGSYKVSIKENYNTKSEFTVNTVLFKAHPADNIDAVRSKTNMRFILIDEAAFFRMIEQNRVREAVEHYVGGSDTWIVFVSTAGESPEGVMYQIQQEENSIYEKIFLYYDIGLIPDKQSQTTIYKPENIEIARRSRSFARNYMLSWISGEGNVFTHEEVDLCFDDFDYKIDGSKIIAIDPAYGSSNFGVVIGVLKNGILYITFAKEYNRSTPSYMVQEVIRLYHSEKCSICLCDGHYSGEIRDLQQRNIPVQAFEFNTENKSNMVNSASDRVKQKLVKIHRSLKDLGGQMKAAKTDQKGHLDKRRMNLDMLECFCMICERLKTSGLRIVKLNETVDD